MPRRWTLMIIPHSSDEPRSISVSERALRVGGWLAMVIVLVALIGLGTIIAQLGRLGAQYAVSPVAGSRHAAISTSASHDLAALRTRVANLRGVLDTIRDRDARLRTAAGLPGADSESLLGRFFPRASLFRRSATVAAPPNVTPAAELPPDSAQLRSAVVRTQASTDSLLEHAGHVAERLGSLADSVGRPARGHTERTRKTVP